MSAVRQPETLTEDDLRAPSLVADADRDPIVVAEEMLAQGADPWEVLIQAGLEAQNNMDRGRWRIGDMALLVEKRYGDDALAKYATSIRVPVSRARQYRAVCRFWDRQNSKRLEFWEYLPNVTYTHFLYAMRLKDVNVAAEFLRECSDNDWTSDQAYLEISRRLGKPTPPKKLIDTEVPIRTWGKQVVSFTLSPDQMLKLLDSFRGKRKVRLVIHEVETAEAEVTDAAHS